MKKTGLFKAAGAALLMAAVVGFMSCNNGSKDNPGEPVPEASYVEMTDSFQTYYLNLADVEWSGFNGFHLKNLNTDKKVGIVIDKIFGSDSMSEEGATVAWNFDDPETGSNYWGFEAGTKADGVWSSGEIAEATSPAEAPEEYITGFGSPAFINHVYLGIVAKNFSSEAKGDDISLIPTFEGNADTEKAITFRAFTKK